MSPQRVLADAVALVEEDDSAETWERALSAVEGHVTRADDEMLHSFYLIALDRTGRRDELLQAGRQVLLRNPKCFIANYMMGKSLCDAAQYSEAIGYLRDAHKTKPENLEAHVLLARCAGRQNVADAEPLYQELLKRPEFKEGLRAAAVYNELGIWYVNDGRYPLAMSYFNHARQYSGRDPSVTLNIAILHDQYTKKTGPARTYYVNYLSDSELSDPRKAALVKERLKALARLQ